MKPSRSSSGFSLIEMLVVLGLLALVISISLPYSRQSGDSVELLSLTQDLASLLRDSRVKALSTNRPVVVTIDVKDNWAESLEINRRVTFSPRISVEVATDRRQIDASKGGISFFPDGGSTGGKIVLNGNGDSHEIAISWLTGSVVFTPVRAGQ